MKKPKTKIRNPFEKKNEKEIQDEYVERERRRLVRKRHRVSQVIQKEIEQTGLELNPSVSALLRFGELVTLDERTQRILASNAHMNQELYHSQIIPRIPQILRALLQDTRIYYRITQANHMSIEDIRRAYAREYTAPKNHWQKNGFPVTDIPTLNTLYNTAPLPQEHYTGAQVEYINDSKRGRMVSFRPKEVAQLSEKQKRKVRIVEEKGLLSHLYDFLADVVREPESYWDPNIRKRFLSTYPQEVTDTLVGDNLGLKVIFFDANEAQERQNNLLSRTSNITGTNRLATCGFSLLEERIEDHRARMRDLRPGGIHLTAVETSLHLPIEIQLLSLVDDIYDKFGPHAHWRYSKQGKKLHEDYK